LTTGGEVTLAKYAGDFLSTGIGARALGMGGAYVAVARDGLAAYWNPAGLAFLDRLQLQAMHAERFAGLVKYDYAGVALPSRGGMTLALSLIRLGVDNIPITALYYPDFPVGAVVEVEKGVKVRNSPYVVRWVNDSEMALLVSYARKYWRTLSYGGNIKFVYKAVGDYRAWGLGFDVGLLMNPVADLWFGVNLQDVTTTLVAWNTGRRELIAPTLKWGFCYPLVFSDLKLTPALDGDVGFENRRRASQVHLGSVSLDFHLGSELLYRDVLALRVGLDRGSFTAGAGIALGRLNIDYAFLLNSALNRNVHRVSLALGFERAKAAVKRHRPRVRRW